MNWKEYYEDPFGYVDKTYINILGCDLLLFKYHDRLRKIIWWGAWAATIAWVVMGFDSGYGQIEYAVYAAKDYLLKPSSHLLVPGAPTFWESVIAGWNWAYGKTMHWSAFTIYGLLYWATSWHLENDLGFTKTRNSAFTLAFTLFNIGIFEWAWMAGYAYFHDQWWTVTWRMPQLRILIQNVGFTFVGLSTLSLFWLQSLVHDDGGHIVGRIYRFRPSKALLAISLITVAFAALWVYYPWDVKGVSTYIEGYGPWQNSKLFPQTLYTVDLDISDNINVGEWFYVQDDMVHFLNTWVKTLLAMTGLYFIRSWRT